ncbi:MAG: hypothetical protein J6S21_06765, partial [Victivallales bacterium]|nr:hypothetical protein [Victivallales bacterium]
MSRTRTSIFTLAAVCLAFGAVSLLSSCRRLSPGEELDSILESRNRPKQVEIDRERRLRQLDTEVKRRFRLVRDLIWSGDFDRAGAILATMDTLTEYREELDKLKELLHLARTMGVNETELALDQQRILNEAANLNSLPGTYGKTVTISPDMEPLKLPEGPLEKMLSQKISLKVNGMKLADLAMKLRELDGVNLADPVNVIINDAAVKDKTFSCNFTDVSLQELFTFISRNIGVSFNVSENMIWVTADAAN